MPVDKAGGAGSVVSNLVTQTKWPRRLLRQDGPMPHSGHEMWWLALSGPEPLLLSRSFTMTILGWSDRDVSCYWPKLKRHLTWSLTPSQNARDPNITPAARCRWKPPTEPLPDNKHMTALRLAGDRCEGKAPPLPHVDAGSWIKKRTREQTFNIDEDLQMVVPGHLSESRPGISHSFGIVCLHPLMPVAPHQSSLCVAFDIFIKAYHRLE